MSAEKLLSSILPHFKVAFSATSRNNGTALNKLSGLRGISSV